MNLDILISKTLIIFVAQVFQKFKKIKFRISKNWLNNKDNIQISDCSFIFCARLLKSKEVLKFIEL